MLAVASFNAYEVEDYGKGAVNGIKRNGIPFVRRYDHVGDCSWNPNNYTDGSFDAFECRLEDHDISYVHPVKKHSWWQRVVRFYDPDRHIIEVGEQMESVVSRFIEGGMTLHQIADIIDNRSQQAHMLELERRRH